MMLVIAYKPMLSYKITWAYASLYILSSSIKGEILMSKASVSGSDIRDRLMQDKEYQNEYERLKPRYEIIAQFINARQEQNITQAEMAERMGTKKSNISRFESGSYNPSLDFLVKAAASLGKRIECSLR